jgi:hypothetical protein
MLSALLQALVFHGLLAHAQSSFQLGYIPLTVKTPYLNGWIVSNTGSSPEQAWPNFYTTERVSLVSSEAFFAAHAFT